MHLIMIYEVKLNFRRAQERQDKSFLFSRNVSESFRFDGSFVLLKAR